MIGLRERWNCQLHVEHQKFFPSILSHRGTCALHEDVRYWNILPQMRTKRKCESWPMVPVPISPCPTDANLLQNPYSTHSSCDPSTSVLSLWNHHSWGKECSSMACYSTESNKILYPHIWRLELLPAEILGRWRTGCAFMLSV